MKIDWKATNETYHAIIHAQTLDEKEALYREHFLQPWQTMMQMVGGGAESDDEFSGARAFAWHTPDELDHIPDALTQLENANAWQIGKDALHTGIRAFDDYDLPFDTVEGWLMLGVPERNHAQGDGYTGAIDFTYPRFICQYFEPHARNIKALSGAVVHELNHLIRLRIQPWDMMNTTVGDYIIHEGIAESFATACFGEDVLGFYASDISDDDLVVAKTRVGNNLDVKGFNQIRGYIFGDSMASEWGFDPVGMPNFGGYAVGYRVVQAFLANTDYSIQVATYLPAEQIIAESGYFA